MDSPIPKAALSHKSPGVIHGRVSARGARAVDTRSQSQNAMDFHGHVAYTHTSRLLGMKGLELDFFFLSLFVSSIVQAVSST